MSLEGDDGALDALIACFDGAAAAKEIREAVAERVAEVAETQYAAGQGPEGQAWPPNTSNNRFPSLRRLTAAIAFRATEEGIAATGDEILRYHSPRSAAYAHLDRPTFPAQGKLSVPWAAAADEGAEKALAERFGPKR